MIFSCPAKAFPPPPVMLIDFTIDGTPYQAEEGMTWEQWVNSSYNPGDFYVRYGAIYKRNVPGYVVYSGEMQVGLGDTITSRTYGFNTSIS